MVLDLTNWLPSCLREAEPLPTEFGGSRPQILLSLLGSPRAGVLNGLPGDRCGMGGICKPEWGNGDIFLFINL